MKKFIALFIALFVISSVVPAMAGPFSDVKPGHWAYEAIKDLSSKGILEGYPDGTFKGGKALTRYEAAQMVARLIEKGGVGDYETLQKLTIEFADELALLGVKVTALEDEMKVIRAEHDDMMSKVGHMGMGKIKVTAEDRIRFQENSWKTIAKKTPLASNNASFNRFRLNMAAKVDENVSAFISFQDMTTWGAAKQNANVAGAANFRDLFLGYVDVKNFGGWLDNMRFGRQTLTIGKGFIMDGEVDGLLAKKEYRGTQFSLAGLNLNDYTGAPSVHAGLNTKMFTVDHAWKRIAAGAYFLGIDRAEVPGFFGNLTVIGLTFDAKLGKDVVGYVDLCSMKDKGYVQAVRGGLTQEKENGMGAKGGLEWTINKYYDLSVLYQNRGKDFFVLGHNDDYSDSAFYGNGPLLGGINRLGGAIADTYNNSNIMSVIFGAKLRSDLQLDLWYEALKGDKKRTDLFGTTTNLTGNYDQTAAQAIFTYQYRDNTSFKLRYRSLKYSTSDPDYAILVPAFRPADADQFRLDMNVKF